MKLSTQDEYGLRCLVTIGRLQENHGATIPTISEAEGLTPSHVGKILTVLRQAGLVHSQRGQFGGYTLARPADQILISDVMDALGGKLIESNFCDRHKGIHDICVHKGDCRLRPLWNSLQSAIDEVLESYTLADLLAGAPERTVRLTDAQPARRPTSDVTDEAVGVN